MCVCVKPKGETMKVKSRKKLIKKLTPVNHSPQLSATEFILEADLNSDAQESMEH